MSRQTTDSGKPGANPKCFRRTPNAVRTQAAPGRVMTLYVYDRAVQFPFVGLQCGHPASGWPNEPRRGARGVRRVMGHL